MLTWQTTTYYLLRPSAACLTFTMPFKPTVGRTLKWSDEFSYSGSPDPRFWTHELGIGPNNNGWDHEERQYYTARLANSYVSDGTLKIVAKREYFNQRHFTSARIITRNDMDFKYGRVEIRAKLPIGSGTWSAMWMLSSTDVYGEWPKSGEIDILEHVGNWPSTVTASTHSWANNHRTSKSLQGQSCAPVTDWRVYGIEWTANSIRAFVDDDVYFDQSKPRWANWEAWPFDHKFFLVLNLAVGGKWGEAVRGLDWNAFDGAGQVLEIDYVRIWQ